MDEPLSNLDARLRVQIRAELNELLDRLGATTLYVTHDQAEAMTLGDRVAVVDHGRLQQVAPPQELYEQPANLFVAGFIGNPPMNLLPAKLTPFSESRLRLRLGEQGLPLPAAATERWRPWLDAPLTAGIRPEHLALTSQESGLRAVVHDAEYLGHETLLYLRIDGAALTAPVTVARLSGIRMFHKGEAVRVAVHTTHLHLFDTAGQALDHGIFNRDNLH
jgi:ABC-type sugar transport system ATPase subunit